jgi:sugar lactone lactonase YvrE
VLPPTRVGITRAMKKEFDLPKCVVGKTYRAEGVPTDVEMGPDGNLYVTSLPGVPGEGLPTGRIYRIDPATGDVSRMAGGLVSPVGLAISPTGDAYVSMLFASTLLKVPFGGEPEPFAEVPFPGDVEFSDGFVYATETDLTNDGSTPPSGRVLRWDTTVPAP